MVIIVKKAQYKYVQKNTNKDTQLCKQLKSTTFLIVKAACVKRFFLQAQ